MIKTLVINCSLDRKATNLELVKAVKRFSDYTSIQFREIQNEYEIGEDIDAVVISGSKARIVNPSHREMYYGIINLIKRKCV